MKQYPAKIFLAEKQAIRECETARTASVFSGTNGWFGNLYVVNDETLAPGFSLPIATDYGTVFVLPVVGDLLMSINARDEILACGEGMLIDGNAGEVTISNPYDNELVNFLQVRLHVTNVKTEISRVCFELENISEKLVTLIDRKDVKIFLGKLGMRHEAEFVGSERGSGVFCFVIQGSFEIEGRLLHHRDALAIWNADEIEIESLGKESILLLIEVPVR